MVNASRLAKTAWCGATLALGVIALGAFTRLIDAGLGCPDWPGCYGHLVAPLTNSNSVVVVYKAWAEMIHRYFVGGLSLLILAIITMILITKSLRTRSNIIYISLLILLLCYQIMLGQWTVTLKLLPVIVSQHLLGGFLIFAMLWLVYLNNGVEIPPTRSRSATPFFKRGVSSFAFIGLVLLLLQIALGAWTSTNYASLSCPDFPFCVNKQSWMTMSFKAAFNLFSPIGVNYEGGVLSESVRQTIQMTHRMGALVVTAYWFILAIISLNTFKNSWQLIKPVYWILGLLSIQVCLGIANVIFKLPLVTAVSHTVVAALLLVSVITFIFRLAGSKT